VNWLRRNSLNLFLVLLTAFILSGFQTTFWFQMFGSLPSPLLWLDMVLYLILYRRRLEGILSIYAVGMVLNPFTAMPLGIIWLNLLVVFAVMTFFKKRVFWPSSRYFFIASFGTALTWHISYFFVSHLFEANPATVFFFHRVAEIVFTGLISVPIFTLMSWLDRFSHKETLPESGGIEA
jgi:hypothetical protein